jgi:hypothetical protein
MGCIFVLAEAVVEVVTGLVAIGLETSDDVACVGLMVAA